METCETCRHWDARMWRNDVPEYGFCSVALPPWLVANIDDGGRMSLAWQGCGLHKEKDGSGE